mmetsp:Transcript_9775/g.23616  ORF Transcript_9775/g.23616 Transcript_9775/m.23616 type:complete len:373 (+) Transcript_9775:801-1919(+)
MREGGGGMRMSGVPPRAAGGLDAWATAGSSDASLTPSAIFFGGRCDGFNPLADGKTAAITSRCKLVGATSSGCAPCGRKVKEAAGCAESWPCAAERSRLLQLAACGMWWRGAGCATRGLASPHTLYEWQPSPWRGGGGVAVPESHGEEAMPSIVARSATCGSSSVWSSSLASSDTCHHALPEKSGGRSQCGESVSNGSALASSAYITTPIAQTSAAADHTGPRTTSGAVYPGVPKKERSRAASSMWHAWPKSHSLTSYLMARVSMSTFSNLTSRWITCRPCRCRSAEWSWRTIGKTVCSLSAPWRCSSCWQSPPGTTSIMMAHSLSVSKKAWAFTMLSCAPISWRSAASRRNKCERRPHTLGWRLRCASLHA